MPVRPKESSDELSADFFAFSEELSPWSCPFERTAATPTPSAIINGTVIGPVVAPPASKAIPWNSPGQKYASVKTAA